jgi:surface antigen
MKRFQLLLIKILPYAFVFAALYAIMFFGSQHSGNINRAPIASIMNDADFTVTADQISESYTVATIANSISLPSNATISENYATVNAIYESTGIANTSGSVIDRPTIIDIDPDVFGRRGIVKYTVAEGDTIESILSKNNISGVSADQVRWSNGLKNANLTVGKEIYLPTVSGIIYTVKNGDTYEGIAKKYGSNYEEMILRNDLENTEIKTGMLILLPNGELPETERPEYEPPKPKRSSSSSSSRSSYSTGTYVTDSGVRKGMHMIGSYAYWRDMYYSTKGWNNPGAFGNCTWFAWYWRRANMPSNYWLPTGTLGNARSWNSSLAARGFPVGKTPAYGAVVQTSTSGYGHVGVVVSINEGVSITIQEMNYAGPNGKFNIVYESTIDWAHAVNFNYIYGK